MPLRTATDTGAFINSFGVVTHLEQGWQYEDAGRTVSVLKELGITQVRDGFVGVGSPGRGALEYAAQQGVKFTFNIHPGWTIPTVIAQLEAWVARFPGSVMAIEGPNEVNNWPVAYQGKTGIQGAQAFQRDLYAAVNASSALKDIPVIGVTSWPVFQNDSDIGNIHAYEREGDFLTQNIKTALADENAFNPGKTVWMTEAGYHTRVGSNYHEGVSEAVQAKMIPSLFLSAFEQGIAKTFAYQLANQYPDPNTQESYFGLVTQNWTPKPAFTALKNTIAILKQGESGQHAAAGSLGYDLQGLPATAHHKLFRSDNGDWIVAVWNEPDIWNEHTNTEIQNPTSLVSLKLDQTHPGLALFDPLTGTTAIQSATNANALAFTLDDHPIFIKIQSGGTTPVQAPAAPSPVAVPAPLPPPPTAPTANSSEITVRVSGDHYLGSPHFNVAVDGKTVATNLTTTAVHNNGEWVSLKVLGDFAQAPKQVSVTFTDDAWAGTPSTDKNLYVDYISVNGTRFEGESVWPNGGDPHAATMWSNGTLSFDTTRVAASAPTAPAPVTQQGELTVRVSADHYQGAPHFDVTVDGKVVSANLTTTAVHSKGEWVDLTVRGNFDPTPETVAITFKDDAWAGTRSTDKNLYVDYIKVNGQRFEGESIMPNKDYDPNAGVMLSNGTLTFDLFP